MTLGEGQQFAGYTVVRVLGSGGMGQVYLAQHPRLPRQEALKILRPEISTDESFRERFIREADSVAALDHPNIVTVFDRGDTDGQLWIATQYIDGADAGRLLRERYPAGMPVDEVVVITAAIAEALDYAHGRGILHRDVKPANILLALPDDEGQRRVYLADFGIARPIDDPAGLTATNFTVGTVAYAAPEQLMGNDIDGRADQYALAATAYHLLTGTPLYPDSNPVAVISRHLAEPPPRLSSARADLAPLDAVFSTALAKKPGDRFPSCRGFARALAAAVIGAAGQDYSPTAPTQQAPIPITPTALTPAARRSPTRALLATGVLAILLVGAALLWRPWAQHPAAPTPTPPIRAAAPVTTTTLPSSANPLPPSTTPSPTTTISSTPPTPTSPTYSSSVAAAPTAVVSSAAIVGSGCAPQSSPAVDPDGVQVYCAQFPRTDGFIWTREVVRFPCGDMTCTGVETTQEVLDTEAVVSICVAQTGWTPSACASAIANATYRGDGPRPICMGESSECNPGRR